MPRNAWSKAARLSLAVEEPAAANQYHLQVLAAGLPGRATVQAHGHLGDFQELVTSVDCGLPEGGRMVCVLILIDDLKTDGAGRVECDVVLQI